MKKQFILFVCLLMAATVAKADIAASVMLRHNGNATFFAYNEVQNAVDAAVEGDTIYLTEGTFSPFNVDKRIMVRGTGWTTVVEGDCNINISGTAKLPMPVLDGLALNGNVNVQSAYNQFTLRKVRVKKVAFAGEEHYDVKLDRCDIYGILDLAENVKEINAFNCRILQITPHNYVLGHATFEHCNIKNIYSSAVSSISATFNSCVLYGAYYAQNSSAYPILVGCVLNSCTYYNATTSILSTSNYDYLIYTSSTTFVNCKNASSLGNGYANNVLSFNNTNYLSALDGTKIGAYGGQHPFTLWSELPAVTKHSVKVDAANKKLNVTLTLEKRDKPE